MQFVKKGKRDKNIKRCNRTLNQEDAKLTPWREESSGVTLVAGGSIQGSEDDRRR